MVNQYELRQKLQERVDALKEIFNEIHCSEAKLKLLEAQMWAERALNTDKSRINGAV